MEFKQLRSFVEGLASGIVHCFAQDAIDSMPFHFYQHCVATGDD